jgi:hypothetical protein
VSVPGMRKVVRSLWADLEGDGGGDKPVVRVTYRKVPLPAWSGRPGVDSMPAAMPGYVAPSTGDPVAVRRERWRELREGQS